MYSAGVTSYIRFRRYRFGFSCQSFSSEFAFWSSFSFASSSFFFPPPFLPAVSFSFVTAAATPGVVRIFDESCFSIRASVSPISLRDKESTAILPVNFRVSATTMTGTLASLAIIATIAVPQRE